MDQWLQKLNLKQVKRAVLASIICFVLSLSFCYFIMSRFTFIAVSYFVETVKPTTCIEETLKDSPLVKEFSILSLEKGEKSFEFRYGAKKKKIAVGFVTKEVTTDDDPSFVVVVPFMDLSPLPFNKKRYIDYAYSVSNEIQKTCNYKIKEVKKTEIKNGKSKKLKEDGLESAISSGGAD